MKCGNLECNNEAKVKYCSRSCAAITTNKLYPKRKRTSKVWKVCSVCGDLARGKRHQRCRIIKDRELHNDKTIAECMEMSSVKGKHPSWKSVHIRHFCRSWNKHLRSYPCQVCGYTIHVELAHIKPVTSFPPETKLSEVNSSDNLLVLCPNHHWEFDNGLIRLDQIPARLQ